MRELKAVREPQPRELSLEVVNVIGWVAIEEPANFCDPRLRTLLSLESNLVPLEDQHKHLRCLLRRIREMFIF